MKTDRAPGHVVVEAAAAIVRKAIVHLLLNREVRKYASVGPDYMQLNGITSEQRARELAAAVHAALYRDPEPLDRAWLRSPSVTAFVDQFERRLAIFGAISLHEF
ncbi:hypothetical protein ACFZA1_32160 [Streptomyces filipinensis]|uniref:hypothetical protein n=1 Tax=Streptomyces filipinensis TaxID=66887 RepID=UPI0036E73920